MLDAIKAGVMLKKAPKREKKPGKDAAELGSGILASIARKMATRRDAVASDSDDEDGSSDSGWSDDETG